MVKILKKAAKIISPRKIKDNCSKPREEEQKNEPIVISQEDLKDLTLSGLLDKNINLFNKILGPNKDVVIRRFTLGPSVQSPAAIIYMEGLTDKAIITGSIIKPLMLEFCTEATAFSDDLLEIIINKTITASNVKETHSVPAIVSGVLYGDVVLLIDGCSTALTIGVKKWHQRSIEEPESEVLVRGPREGFTENLRTNVTQIRRRLRTTNLIFEDFQIGRVTDTGVSICYLKEIVRPELVEEVRRRLGRIDIDGVLESNYLEELIVDDPSTPFPLVTNTQRPDRVVAELLEGRVAIITDGTPFALVVPGQFVSFLQTPEDYYQNFLLSSALRILRYITFAVSILLPSLYIAITTFHQEMIPTPLLISIAASREGVPFPALFEALAMEFTFEVLREGGLRLPRSVGQAVSIVGALVIGQAAVQAGIVSPLMVIIVAFTGVASFSIPTYNIAISLRLLRFPIMLLAGTLGLFGIMIGLLTIIIHLSGLRSFGVPYLSPLSPFHADGLKDALVRPPIWGMDKRPEEIVKTNRRRQGRGLKPEVPKGGGRDEG